ncbi:MAG TPA: hypothetical protein VEX68_12200 [Bryobacteraceae bacterium]|nr:hypothetical protein [Bryobacteraceae bacterium]
MGLLVSSQLSIGAFERPLSMPQATVSKHLRVLATRRRKVGRRLPTRAPFDADGSLGTVVNTVKLTTVGAPTPHVTETK